MLDEFDQEVGLHYLRAVHLNDSKGTTRTSTPDRPLQRPPWWAHRVMNFCSLSLLDLKFVGKLGCNLDRHEDIGKGCIGIPAFRDIVNEPRLDNIPLILETPGR